MVRDPHGRFVAAELPHGWRRYYQGCRCDVCRDGVRVHVAERRAERRGLRPVPDVPVPDGTETVADVRQDAAPVPDGTPGPCVRAVRLQTARMGVREAQPVLCAVAECMAAILDDRRQVTTMPSACRQLMSVMAELHKGMDTRQSRLRVVQKMMERPDDG